MTGESANGTSTSAFIIARPQNRWRSSTQATMTPKLPVTATVITVTMAVSWNACRTSGAVRVSAIVPRPDFATDHTIATSGRSSRSATQARQPKSSRWRPAFVRPLASGASVATALT